MEKTGKIILKKKSYCLIVFIIVTFSRSKKNNNKILGHYVHYFLPVLSILLSLTFISSRSLRVCQHGSNLVDEDGQTT